MYLRTWSTFLGFVLLINSGGAATSVQDWNLQSDFSLSASSSRGWSYGSMANQTSFRAFMNSTQVASHYNTSLGIQGWDSSEAVFPLVAINPSSQTYFQTWSPQTVYLGGYSGSQEAVVRWTNPLRKSASAEFNVSFRRVESATNFESRYWVLLNGKVIETGTLVDLNSAAIYKGRLPIEPGDTLDFVVGNDGTNWQGTGLAVTASIQTLS